MFGIAVDRYDNPRNKQTQHNCCVRRHKMPSKSYHSPYLAGWLVPTQSEKNSHPPEFLFPYCDPISVLADLFCHARHDLGCR